MGTDITLDPPVDGQPQLFQQWLNNNVRDALWLILSPPTCMLWKSNTMTYLASNVWNAIEFNEVIADTEDPATPMFAKDETLWDFEAGASSWTTNDGVVVADTTDFYNGAQSLKWTVTTGGSKAATSPLNVRAAVPNNYGSASLWVFALAAKTVNIHHQWRTSGGTLLGGETISSNVVLVANTWTQLKVMSGTKAPATTAFASVALGCTDSAAGNVLKIDDVVLDTYTAPTKITVATPGWYEFTADVPLNTMDAINNSMSLAFRKNGTDYYAGDSVGWATVSVRMTPNFSTMISMAANDYVEVMVRHSRAADLTSLTVWQAPRVVARRVRGL